MCNLHTFILAGVKETVNLVYVCAIKARGKRKGKRRNENKGRDAWKELEKEREAEIINRVTEKEGFDEKNIEPRRELMRRIVVGE